MPRINHVDISSTDVQVVDPASADSASKRWYPPPPPEKRACGSEHDVAIRLTGRSVIRVHSPLLHKLWGTSSGHAVWSGART